MASSSFKVLKKLPKKAIERILHKVDDVKENPYRFLEHFEGKKEHKLRIGDYRALVEIKLQDRLLLIKVFDKRGRVYKR